jgi:hypothetical protein
LGGNEQAGIGECFREVEVAGKEFADVIGKVLEKVAGRRNEII